MVVEMHPAMTVIRTIVEGKPNYELVLSQANINHLLAGCPDFDRLVGHSPGGFYFCVFPDPTGEMSKSFRRMPDGEGYFAYVGAPILRFPLDATPDGLNKLNDHAQQSLESAIAACGRIPIEDDYSFGKVTMGYVVMRIERKK